MHLLLSVVVAILAIAIVNRTNPISETGKPIHKSVVDFRQNLVFDFGHLSPVIVSKVEFEVIREDS